MPNTRKFGQTLRLRKRRHPTLRIGRGGRTNFNTSRRTPARAIEADSTRNHSPFNGLARGDHNITFTVCQPQCGRRLTRGASNVTEALASKTCTPCRGGIPPLTRDKLSSFTHRPRTATCRGSSPHRAELPVSQFPGDAYLCSGDW